MSKTALEKLDRGQRIIPLYINARDRQHLGKDDAVFVGYGYLRELLREPSDDRVCASDSCQHWKLTIIELTPISENAINNTVGLKLDQSVVWWIAEEDLPKQLRFDAKQKDLFASGDPTDDLKVSRPEPAKKTTTTAKASKTKVNKTKAKAKPKATAGKSGAFRLPAA